MSKKGRGGTKASGRSTMARGHGKGADRQVKQVRLFSWRALQIVMLLVLGGLLLTGCTSLQRQEEARLCSRCDPPPRGCTILTVSQGDRVFFGGNGDWINLDSNYYWVDPGSQVHYGAIYFGVPTNVQQGFNEKGLAYDSNGLPSAPVNSHPGRKPSTAATPATSSASCKSALRWRRSSPGFRSTDGIRRCTIRCTLPTPTAMRS